MGSLPARELSGRIGWCFATDSASILGVNVTARSAITAERRMWAAAGLTRELLLGGEWHAVVQVASRETGICLCS
jgi:hypothetical protein